MTAEIGGNPATITSNIFRFPSMTISPMPAQKRGRGRPGKLPVGVVQFKINAPWKAGDFAELHSRASEGSHGLLVKINFIDPADGLFLIEAVSGKIHSQNFESLEWSWQKQVWAERLSLKRTTRSS